MSNSLPPSMRTLPYSYRGVRLDPFQVDAVVALMQDTSTLVCAPTGTGKTLIAEYLAEMELDRGFRVVYTAPIKALVNQKYRKLLRRFGPQRVGIATGDLSVNEEADLVVMTTEVLRNLLVRLAAASDGGATAAANGPGAAGGSAAAFAPGGAGSAASTDRLAGVRWVVFDEIHYLNHEERGTVWEEAILFLPPEMRFLGLSATVPNGEPLRAWLESARKDPVALVVHRERAVPLEHGFFNAAFGAVSRDDLFGSFLHAVGNGDGDRDPKGGHLAFEEVWDRQPRGKRHRDRTSHVDLVLHVAKNRLFPCLYFVLSREGCEQYARELAGIRDFLHYQEKTAVRLAALQTLREMELAPGSIPGFDAMMRIWSRGIAYHHAGMLPAARRVVEELLERRLVRVVYATETFAVGVNMPVRCACFDRLEKFDGSVRRPLTNQEYFQMAGRAGRRGLDRVGTVLVRLDLAQIEKGEIPQWDEEAVEPVASRFSLSYNTVLHLTGRMGDGEVQELLGRTLAAWQDSGAVERLWEDFERRRRVLLRLGYLEAAAPPGPDPGQASDHGTTQDITGGAVEEPKHRSTQSGPAYTLTERGRACSQLNVKELLVVELLYGSVLEGLDAPAVAGLAAALAYEPRPVRKEFPLVAPSWQAAVAISSERLRRTLAEELGGAVPAADMAALKVFPYVAPMVARWAQGAGLAELLRDYPMEPGDFVALCRQAIDMMRQMRRALEEAESEVPGAASKLLAEAIAAVDRDVVRERL